MHFFAKQGKYFESYNGLIFFQFSNYLLMNGENPHSTKNVGRLQFFA